VRGVGFEPTKGYEQQMRGAYSFADVSSMLQDFRRFLLVDRCKSKVTARDHRRLINLFLNRVSKPIDQIGIEDVREYMLWLRENKSVGHYTNALSGLKSFFRDFLKRPEIVDGFKFPAKEVIIKSIPSREDLARFYHALPDIRIKALFLMLASTGLRLGEVLSLKLDDVDFTKRMVVPKCHTGNTKRSWISFFNAETHEVLEQFLKVRWKHSPKLFPISEPVMKKSWDAARQETGLILQRKTLRDWFADEMGRLGVQDRYIDAFQGRTPKSVLARHYSDYAPEKLHVIYEKADIRVLELLTVTAR